MTVAACLHQRSFTKCVGEIAKAEETADGTVRVCWCSAPDKKGLGGERHEEIFDNVVLATGRHLTPCEHPLMLQVSEQWCTSSLDSVPLLDHGLRWGDAPIYCTGAMALLEIGADAMNLSGAREAGLRIANSIFSELDTDSSCQQAC